MWIYIEINSKGIVFVEWCVYFCDLTKLQNSKIKIKFFLFHIAWAASADGRNMPQVLKPNQPWGLDIVRQLSSKSMAL